MLAVVMLFYWKSSCHPGPDPGSNSPFLRHYYVYILTNKRHGTLYIGVTNHIGRRLFQHKFATANSFTHKYKLDKLVDSGSVPE